MNPSITAATTSLLVLGLTRALTAEVVIADYTDADHYEYQRLFVPDVDQERDGLFNDGKCYCVPASCFNMLGYIANWGFPEIDPGQGSWGSQSRFDDVTAWLGWLGFIMETDVGGDDPDCEENAECDLPCGTGYSNAVNELRGWLPDDQFFILHEYTHGAFAPTDSYLAGLAVISGNPIMAVAYGRYDLVGVGGGVQLYKRGGGHSVTLVGAFADGDERYLYSRDPAQDNDDLTVQSLFATNEYTSQNLLVGITQNETPPFTWTPRVMTALAYPHADGRLRLIDAVIAVIPLFGYSWAEWGGVAVPMGDGIGLGAPNPPQEPFVAPSGAPILDMAADLGGTGFVMLSSEANELVQSVEHYNPTTGETVKFPAIPFARQVVIGRYRDLYVLSLTKLYRLDFDEPEILNEVDLPWTASAIAYDDAEDRVLVLSATGQQLLSFPRLLESEVDPTWGYDLPSPVQLGAGVRMAIHPDGLMYVVSGASDVVWSLEITPDDQVQETSFVSPDIQGPTSVDFDDAGRMYVVADGGVLVFEQDPRDGSWVRGDSPFDGVEVGDVVKIARSRTNFTPGEHDTPDWDHIESDQLVALGTAIPDCIGDLDGSGAVDVSDLLSLLNAWGPCAGCPEDVDGDDGVGTADLLDLIAAWGACP